jgi:hypothetical protein
VSCDQLSCDQTVTPRCQVSGAECRRSSDLPLGPRPWNLGFRILFRAMVAKKEKKFRENLK